MLVNKDRLKALELAAKYHGLLLTRIEATVNVEAIGAHAASICAVSRSAGAAFIDTRRSGHAFECRLITRGFGDQE